LSSAITPVELLSALGRKKRSGDLSEEEFSMLLSRIQSERIRWELVEIAGPVLDRAEEVIQGPLPLRALDALHVASSMAFQAAASVQIPFVTGDGRQRDAANHLGLDVIWVG
jgi:predicted nucleic acid-binding protein